MKTRSKTASVVRILAANVIVLAVGIVILELVFGAWLNPDRLNRLNLLRNRIFKEDVSRLYPTNEPVITYSRDKYGLRGPYRDDPARIDILTVGGSTTDQRFISDGSTWQDVLQKGLASAGVPVGIANAGVDGHTTVGHIQAFDWWFPYVPRLKPKYILFYVGINDFDIDENVNFDEFMSGSIVGEIKNSSAIWHAVRVVRGIYLAFFFGLAHQKIDFGKVEWTTEPLQTDYAFMKPRLDAYGQRLRILVRKTHDFGSRPIFVTQPSRLFRLAKDEVEGSKEETSFDGRKINGVDYYHLKRKFDEEIQIVSRQSKVPFIDLASMSGWEDADFYDFYHMTPTGARKVGEYLSLPLKDILTGANAGGTLHCELIKRCRSYNLPECVNRIRASWSTDKGPDSRLFISATMKSTGWNSSHRRSRLRDTGFTGSMGKIRRSSIRSCPTPPM